jgi:hypothetical protein
LQASGLDVTFQLQQLLLSVAEEQADGSIIYSDAIVDAGARLYRVFLKSSFSSPLTLLLLSGSFFVIQSGN